MEQIPFGKHHLKASRIGLGLAALGRPGYINLGHGDDLGPNIDVSVMEEHAHSILDAAWDAGVRYFDAARSYGRAEAFLSSWLHKRAITPEDLTIGSKWGYTYTANWHVEAEKHEVKEHTLPVLQRQIGESAALLNDFIRIYHIHSATLSSGVLDNRPVLHALADLRAHRGWLIGLSLSGSGQADTLKRALDIEFDGQRLFSSVQATWNLLEKSIEPTLIEAAEAGLGIIVKEAVANGRLTARNPIAQIETLAQQEAVTPDAVALAAVLARPWASIILSGAATKTQLRQNLAALTIRWKSDWEETLEPLIEPAASYWQTRSELRWN